MGSFIQLNFSQNEGVFQSIIADSSIDASKENSYFEVEIDNKPKNETTIVIGFASDADYIKTFYPGAYPSSVGFKSSAECIEVMMNTKAMITFEYKVKFGDTLGLLSKYYLNKQKFCRNWHSRKRWKNLVFL